MLCRVRGMLGRLVWLDLVVVGLGVRGGVSVVYG